MPTSNLKIIRKPLMKLTFLNRTIKRLIMMFIDALMLISILFFSFSLRLDSWYWPKSDELFFIIFGAPLIAIPIFMLFKLYHSIVRYIGGKALSSIVQAVSLYAVIWGLFGYTF